MRERLANVHTKQIAEIRSAFSRRSQQTKAQHRQLLCRLLNLRTGLQSPRHQLVHAVPRVQHLLTMQPRTWT